MQYLILKDRRFSVDGVNVIDVEEGDVIENPSNAMLDALGGDCEVFDEDTDELEDTQNDPE